MTVRKSVILHAMLRRIARYLVVLALLLSIGGHWVVLQSAAWTGMLIGYAMQGTITEAVGMTFDGRHPCKLCKVVDQGTKSSPKPASNEKEPVKKIQLFAEATPEMWVQSYRRSAAPSDAGIIGPVRQWAPPVPPPRAA